MTHGDPSPFPADPPIPSVPTAPQPVLPLGYYTPSPMDRDLSHLRILAIVHYVWGGLCALLSCVHIIYIVMGAMELNDAGSVFGGPTGSPSPATPALMGWLFIVIGTGLTLLGWLVGGLNLISARLMQKRRRRLFSLIMAGVNCAVGFLSAFNCLTGPMGITLGVFTFIVLLRPSVKSIYAEQTVPII